MSARRSQAKATLVAEMWWVPHSRADIHASIDAMTDEQARAWYHVIRHLKNDADSRERQARLTTWRR